MFFNITKNAHILFKKCSSQILIKRSIKSWNVVFFGSDKYSLHCLKKLHSMMRENVIKNLETVSLSISSPVYNYAVENNFKAHLWPPDLNGKYDIGVVVSFGKFIPKKMIDIFPLGIINVHPSLLPKWRGGMPISHALKNGDKETGISIMKINTKIDTGDIIMKKSIPIGENEVLPSLYKRLQILGGNCLTEVFDGMPECLEKTVSQANEKGTYAKVIQKEARVVNWEKMTAEEIYNLYRALFGLYTLKTSWHGNYVKLICMSLNNTCDDFIKNTRPGTVKYSKQNQCLIVQCKDKSLRLCTVQLKDKLYTALNFHMGYLGRISPNMRYFGT